ncbi:TPA: helix-turn-helix domain-containing protein [Streptococcus suis]
MQKMKFELFNQLYIEALEQSDLEYYITERGWQEWMEPYEAQDIADILSTIHKLANSTLAESRGCSRAEFARKFDIPVRTLEDWDSGKRVPPMYVKKLIDFARFMDR